jgi:two-component system OmpR family sensor kinase
MTALLAAVGLAAVVLSHQLVESEIDSFLDTQLRKMALNAGPGFASPAPDAAAADEAEDELVVQIYDSSGRLVHDSAPSVGMPSLDRAGYSNVRAAGEDWRVYRVADSRRAVQVGQRQSFRANLAARAATGAALPLLLALPLAWLVISWSLSQILLRLRDLSTRLADRGVKETEALAVDLVPTEIAPLIDAMNTLIGRHQEALDQQKRFVSDAAHELRTPLAALQIQVDNLQAQELDRDAREIVADLKAGVLRSSALIRQLLKLARLDAPVSASGESVDLGDALRDAAADFISLAGARDLSFDFNLLENARVIVNAADLRIILGNLLDNAVRYSTPGGTILLRLRKLEEGARIEIADAGHGITPEALPRLFDRFFRAAPPDVVGTGLGLAIAKAAADRNGVALELRNRDDGPGAIATLSFPAVTG